MSSRLPPYPDPRFAELQGRHDARGPAIRLRIALLRLTVAVLALPIIVASIGGHMLLGLSEALQEIGSSWRKAPEILLRRDAQKLRKLVYGKKST